jgi:hypothetical protein
MGLVVTLLTTLSLLNGFYTFYRKRHYRLFEQPIETNPSTPSAHRVRVDSSPVVVTPLRYIQTLIGSEPAASRAHPDATRDVWEIAVWDPNPLCLQFFYFFSPLHVMLYSYRLPVAPLDPQPSVQVFMTLAFAAILSGQLGWIGKSFTQQIKDNAIIQRQVMHEYDTKFVHPSLQRPSRDVGVQVITTKSSSERRVGHSGVGTGNDLASDITTYTPKTVIKRGFYTNPNQAYSSQYDPDNLASQPNPPLIRPGNETPSLRAAATPRYTSTSRATPAADFSSPIRPSQTPNPFRQQPTQFRQSQRGTGDGGSFGVYSHAASPLRKSTSANHLLTDDRGRDSPAGAGERRQDRGATGPIKSARLSALTGSKRF